jgi:hypothetical protein
MDYLDHFNEGNQIKIINDMAWRRACYLPHQPWNHVSIVDILIFESTIFYYVKTFGIVFSHLYFDNISN